MHTNDSLEILKSLANDARLDIVRTLVKDHNDKASCSQISASSKLSQPTMSHHFKKLVESGVVLERRQGTEMIYELNSAGLAKIGIDPKKL